MLRRSDGDLEVHMYRIYYYSICKHQTNLHALIEYCLRAQLRISQILSKTILSPSFLKHELKVNAVMNLYQP